MAGYTRQQADNIVDGGAILAEHHNAEYDAVQAAFHRTAGHKHDGTDAEGAPITVIGPAQDVAVTGSVLRPKTNSVMDVGTATLKFKDGHFSGPVAVGAATTADHALNRTSADARYIRPDQTGAVSLTFDATFTKPVSVADPTATQHVANKKYVDERSFGAAPLNSPEFTGTPKATTAMKSDNSTRIATTAYVKSAVGSQQSIDVSGLTSVTLTSEQAASPILRFEGSLSADCLVVVPNEVRQWTACNLTSGGKEITIRTAAGSGVTLGAGRFEALWCSAVSVYRQNTNYYSPNLIGTPTAPTAANGTANAQIANTAFVAAGFSPNGHTHTIANVTGLQTALDAKVAKTGDTFTGSVNITDTSARLYLNKSGGANSSEIFGRNGTSLRWSMQLGNNDLESSDDSGSNFTLTRYNNIGGPLGVAFKIQRTDGAVLINSNTRINSDSADKFQVNGAIAAKGYRCQYGVAGAYSNLFNISWNGTAPGLWIDSTQIGTISTTSDSRVKHQIRPFEADATDLISNTPVHLWRYADVGLFRDDGQDRVGFTTQEMSQTVPTAVVGVADAVLADGSPQPQSLDTLQLIAILWKSNQELAARIKFLEEFV